MGRGYTADEYRSLAARLRRARPGLALSTDVIVGFPGETDEDFRATLELIEGLRFAALFAFRYSPRPGTAALKLDAAVDAATADRRLQSLLAMQSRIQLELNRELEGREVEVLVTARGREPERRVGRTPCHRLVHFQAPVDDRETFEPGSLVRVRIERALPHSLVGKLATTIRSWTRATGAIMELARRRRRTKESARDGQAGTDPDGSEGIDDRSLVEQSHRHLA
jgi:tRNA-2-methylthio-N6-dimethylallyladenosine synthase